MSHVAVVYFPLSLSRFNVLPFHCRNTHTHTKRNVAYGTWIPRQTPRTDSGSAVVVVTTAADPSSYSSLRRRFVFVVSYLEMDTTCLTRDLNEYFQLVKEEGGKNAILNHLHPGEYYGRIKEQGGKKPPQALKTLAVKRELIEVY